MKKLFAGLIVTTLAVAAVGCGNSNETAGKAEATPEVNVSETNQEVVVEPTTVTVTHDLGETEVAKNPEKVVVFDYGMLDVLDVFEAGVVGVPQGSLPDYLSEFESESYTNVGTLFEPNMEVIFELDPDLIIIGGRQADYYDQLSEIAPTISMTLDTSNYVQSLKSNLSIMGEIFDKEAVISEAIANMDTQMADINKTVTDKDYNSLIILANDSAISVYGLGSRFGIIHEAFGFDAVDESIEVSKHGQNATFEYILEQNPDFIFVVDRAAVAGGENSAKDLIENELVKMTDAYANDRIVYLNPQAWYVANGGIAGTQIMIDDMKAAAEK